MNSHPSSSVLEARLRWLLFVCATLLSILLPLKVQSVISSGQLVNDPLFSLDYDRGQVRFDLLATKDLLPACKRPLSVIKPLPQTLTLYARYATATERIYIAGTDEDIGIYVIRGEDCSS